LFGVRAAAKAADLSAVLGAGIREGGPGKAATVSKLLEELVSTLAPMTRETADVEGRMALLPALHAASQRERASAAAPFVHARTVAPAVDASENSLKELVLQTLDALVASARDSAGDPSAAEALRSTVWGLRDLLADFAPESLFGEWSPAQLAPERPLPAAAIDSRRVYASSAAAACGLPLSSGLDMGRLQADPAALFEPRGAWVAESTAHVWWGVTFAEPQPVSSIKLFWGGAAPRRVAVEVTTDPLPDPLAHATRLSARLPGMAPGEAPPDILLLTSADAAAAASAASAIVTGTPADEEGTGVASTVAVPAALLPPQAVASGAQTGAVPGSVTWRAVCKRDVTAAEAAAPRGGKAVGGGEATSASAGGATALGGFSHIPIHGLPFGAVGAEGGAPAGPADVLRVTAIRVRMSARPADLEARRGVGLAAVQLLTPAGAGEVPAVAPLRVVQNLQGWAHAVAAAGAERPTEQAALTASLQVAMASASQAAVIRYVNALLQAPALAAAASGKLAGSGVEPALALWERELASEHAPAVHRAVATLAGARLPAARRFVAACIGDTQAVAKPGQVDLKWDADECKTTTGERQEVRREGKTIYSRSSNYSICLTDRGFSEGRTVWVMSLDEDSSGGECSCFGECERACGGLSGRRRSGGACLSHVVPHAFSAGAARSKGWLSVNAAGALLSFLPALSLRACRVSPPVPRSQASP
jgi:hypothetical protein